MHKFVLGTALLSATLAMGQTSGIPFRQKTTGTLGITAGQTVRLTAFYPISLAPIAQVSCNVTLTIADVQGNIVATLGPTRIVGGQSLSVDVNHDVTLTQRARVDVRGIATALTGCNLVTSMDLIDNGSQRTVVTVGSELTFPTPSNPSATSSPSAVLVDPTQW